MFEDVEHAVVLGKHVGLHHLEAVRPSVCPDVPHEGRAEAVALNIVCNGERGVNGMRLRPHVHRVRDDAPVVVLRQQPDPIVAVDLNGRASHPPRPHARAEEPVGK